MLLGLVVLLLSVFGLMQIELFEKFDVELMQCIIEFWDVEIVFLRLVFLCDMFVECGFIYEGLQWCFVDLSVGFVFEDFQVGDLLCVGLCWVFLYLDEGMLGVFDFQDFCFDFDVVVVVCLFVEVFQVVEGGGDIEWVWFQYLVGE